MIVTITIPSANAGLKYGQLTIQADQNHQIELPDYIALSALTLTGVTGPTLSGTVASLLAAADQDWEANYLFGAFGQQPPANGKVAAAGTLLTASGTPAVSLV